MPAKFVRFPQDKPRNPRIASDVMPEIKRAFEQEVLRVREIEPKVLRRDGAMGVVNKTDLCNWALAGMLSMMPPESRNRLIAEGRRVCEELQRSKKPIQFPSAGVEPGRGGIVYPEPGGGSVGRRTDGRRGGRDEDGGRDCQPIRHDEISLH